MVLEPIFEQDFHPNSYGFRPKRGAKDALREVDGLLKEGYTYVVDVDFESFFDTIPHDKLMELVKRKISDGRVLTLIEHFLNQDIMEGLKRWKPTTGTPQGAVLSPLLANVYLDPLDHLIDGMGMKMIRYADDFVILSRSREDAAQAMRTVHEWAQTSELTTHPEKTKNIDYEKGEGFDFLGYRFERGYRFVRRKSLTKLRDTIRSKTKRTNGQTMSAIVGSLNRTLRGWYNYFKHAHHTIHRGVDQIVRRRLRAIYRKREKRPSFGRTYADHIRWPNAHFVKLGLFTLLDNWQQEVKQLRQVSTCRSR
jgi:RNA-directed DNA polymerase